MEEEAIRGVKRVCADVDGMQARKLEEPRRVREMPIHWARIWHRLGRALLSREWCSECTRQTTDRRKSFCVTGQLWVRYQGQKDFPGAFARRCSALFNYRVRPV